MVMNFRALNEAVKETNNKYGTYQVLFALYAQIGTNKSNGWTGKSKLDMSQISGEELKAMMIFILLESKAFQIENDKTQILGVSEEKEIENLNPAELQFSMYKLYTNGGIEAVDTFVTNRMVKCKQDDSKENVMASFKKDKLFQKMATTFFTDNYVNNHMKDNQLLAFSLSNELGLQIYNDVTSYYENKLQQTKGNLK